MSRAGEPESLHAAAETHVEHPQCAAGSEDGVRLLVELTGQEPLFEPAELPYPAQLPAQGFSPRATCGLGRRMRRSWSVRIRA